MERLARGVLLRLIVGLSVLGLPACDEEQPATPTAQPTPTPAPVRGVIANFSFDQYFPDIYVGIPLPLSQGGILDVTVDWTFPDSWIFVYIARGTCSFEQLTGDTCPYIVRSETQLPKPRVVVTEPIPAGTYSLILYNVPRTRRNLRLGIGSDNIESVSFQIGLTVGGAATPQAVTVKPVFITGRRSESAAPPMHRNASELALARPASLHSDASLELGGLSGPPRPPVIRP